MTADQIAITPRDHRLLHRAVFLATRADALASPNPRVGCVIADAERVCGEGLYRVDGGPHAEIEALAQLPPPSVLPRGGLTAYVSLEPCSIHGRTPPCAERLVSEGIGRVVVGALDFTPGVCGEGLRALRVGGVPVAFGVAQDIAYALAEPRNVFAAQRRPYTILKQAITADGYAGRRAHRVPITAAFANVISHQWRAEADAILVGVGTVLADAPSLRTRHLPGRSPEVVVLDVRGGLTPKQLTTYFPPTPDRTVHHLIGMEASVAGVNTYLHARRIGKLLVEGGPSTLAAFAAAGSWDEYRAWHSPQPLAPGPGTPVPAAEIKGINTGAQVVGWDTLRRYRPLAPTTCGTALSQH